VAIIVILKIFIANSLKNCSEYLQISLYSAIVIAIIRIQLLIINIR